MIDPIAGRAAALHREAIIIDGHTDILMAVADGKMRLGERFELPDPATWQPPIGWKADVEAKLYNFSPHTSFFQTMGHWDQPDLATYLDDIETIIREVGPDHIGLGTDFFGIERAPTGFAGMQDLPNVTRGLIDRGHSDETILKALGGNYLRVFEQVWK